MSFLFFPPGPQTVWVRHCLPVWKPQWIVTLSWAHLSCLGVVNVTVWDGLWQLHNPVVDLVPAPALNCWNNIWIWDFNLSFKPAQTILVKYISNFSHWMWAPTFIVLGSPFLISGSPRSLLLSRNQIRTKGIKLARAAGCRKFSTFSWNWSLLIRCNRAVILLNFDVITLCTAECEVRLSFDWNSSKLPGVTSSHKAAL